MKSQFITAIAADKVTEAWGGAFMLMFYCSGPRIYKVLEVKDGQTALFSMQCCRVVYRCCQTGAVTETNVNALGSIYLFDKEVALKFADNLKMDLNIDLL